MRFVFKVINFLIIFTVFFAYSGYSQCSVREKIKNVPEIGNPRILELEEEIKTVNLLNSLNLREAQLEFIIGKAREMEQTRKEIYAEFDRYSAEMFRIETKIKRQVETGRVSLDKDLRDQYNRIKKKNDLLFYRHSNKMKEAVKAIEGKLESFQLAAADKYEPCVPPILVGSFIGAADKSFALAPILLLAKKIPAEKYEVEKNPFVTRWMQEIKGSLYPCNKLCEDDMSSVEFLKSMDKARQMDDADFKLRMNDMANELWAKIILEEPELSLQEKIQRFLLSKKSIPMLEKRLSSKK
jgi:hypothetical protein